MNADNIANKFADDMTTAGYEPADQLINALADEIANAYNDGDAYTNLLSALEYAAARADERAAMQEGNRRQ